VHVSEQARPGSSEIDQDRIDAIHARAGHQSDVKVVLRHGSGQRCPWGFN
jgi:hypothetical protein